MTLTITTAAGATDPVSLFPGQTIAESLTPVWQGHKDRHREHCGAVPGPLRNLVCRWGHAL